ncbi:MAG: amidohydrolase family protein [Candidatus Latescibacteria bacterium]|nr:amidohydrolase family protein [Candidatus Latescibacterota bacterium]
MIAFALIRSGILVLLIAAMVTSVQGQGQPVPIAFVNATVIDGVSSTPIRNATVLVAGGKITGLTSGNLTVPSGTRTIDLRGRYVVPGLIDAHAHITTMDGAHTALMSGVTTVRCMGVNHFADVGLRELISADRINGPQILASGYHVRPEPADGFFLDFPDMADLMTPGVHGAGSLRRMGGAMVIRGVDWIKTNATARAGLPETDPREPYFTEAELRALVETGADGNVPVAAHAHGDEGGRAAVLAGVRSIEHGTYLSRETLVIMAQRGTYLVPTVAIVRNMAEPGGEYDIPVLMIRGRHMYPQIQRTVKLAKELGVKIVAGTDTGYGADSAIRLSQELEELVEAGLTTFEAMQSATIGAAELLRLESTTGRIAAGYDADLIIVDRNPLEDIGALHDPLMVVNNGEIALDRLSW